MRTALFSIAVALLAGCSSQGPEPSAGGGAPARVDSDPATLPAPAFIDCIVQTTVETDAGLVDGGPRWYGCGGWGGENVVTFGDDGTGTTCAPDAGTATSCASGTACRVVLPDGGVTPGVCP